MDWFAGNVSEAVTLAKARSKLFIVYIRDNSNEDTKEVDTLWTLPSVQERLNSRSIAIRIDSNEDAFRLFSQIYPVMCIPSVYFISPAGVPLEIVAGKCTEEEFATRIQNAIQLYESALGAGSSSSSPGAGASVSESSPPAPAGGGPPLEVRLTVAQQKIAQRRAEKEREAAEAERQQETERRQLGQEMLKSKQTKEEQKMKEHAEQFKKEKREDELAKQKIREQIQKDREERQRRFVEEKAAQQQQAAEVRSKKDDDSRQQQETAAAERSRKARLQIRFPDGSNQTNAFEASDPLEVVFTWLYETAPTYGRNFNLWTTFPRRKLEASERSSALSELSLTPSAVLLLLPSGGASSTQQPRVGSSSSAPVPATWSWLSVLMSPFQMIWSLVASFLPWGRGPGGPGPSERRASEPAPSTGRATQPPAREGARMRRLHDFPRDGTADDARWNGNSTQQL